MDTTCGGGLNSICIQPDGSVCPCVNSVRNDSKLGNILDDELKTIMLKSKKDEFTKANIITKSECNNCQLKFVCLGGCKADNLWNNKLVTDRHYFCESNKKFINGIFEQILHDIE
ncbi:SPASM domain-containing protein [Spirochaeta cellobiosiphila]|uniref:SPASM domain-containing protein n=1 Tax=Spirochaeta cellobiosiphila TaxID=504483 RepID=UPI000490CCA9